MFRVWGFKTFWRYRVPELLLPEEPGIFKKTQWHFLCSNWFGPASSSEKLFTRVRQRISMHLSLVFMVLCLVASCMISSKLWLISSIYFSYTQALGTVLYRVTLVPFHGLKKVKGTWPPVWLLGKRLSCLVWKWSENCLLFCGCCIGQKVHWGLGGSSFSTLWVGPSLRVAD
jgi:hypothetical protein